MGLMIDGKWDNDANVPSDDRGHFIREASRFRHWITPDGAPGPSGEGGFEAEPNRYHLFVAVVSVGTPNHHHAQAEAS
jgi:glutathionyl-hydroquinone reductase